MSPVVVHKYGGSSLATPDLVGKVADAIAAVHATGARMCVVVSAMGKTTDSLARLASEVTAAPTPRELDVLLSTGERISRALMAMALEARGIPAVSMSGPECGIVTDGPHTSARIVRIDPSTVLAAMDRGRVVIAAGFQGAREDGVLTTLGRGGSDTSAVALAAALGAERCDIFSDVDGIYTADPRICRGAKRLDRIDYDTMEELARQGAKVLHERAVGHARSGNLVVRARSTFGGDAHTVIGPAEAHGVRQGVVGVTGRKKLLRVRVRGSDLAMQMQRVLGDQIPVIATRTTAEHVDLWACGAEIPCPDALAERLRGEFEDTIEVQRSAGSVAIVGDLGHSKSATCALLTRELGLLNIPVEVVLTARYAVLALIPSSEVDRAVAALHHATIEGRAESARALGNAPMACAG
jgi:aspartate kinase